MRLWPRRRTGDELVRELRDAVADRDRVWTLYQDALVRLDNAQIAILRRGSL